MNPEQLAKRFHEVYEELAPEYGYETRRETRVFDSTSNNGRLMIAVCARILVEKDAEIERLTVEREWQPMNTAPRNGDEVLMRVERRAGMSGRCLVGHYMPGGHCIEDHPPIDAGWYFWNGCMFDKASKPTAWMPLPEQERER